MKRELIDLIVGNPHYHFPRPAQMVQTRDNSPYGWPVDITNPAFNPDEKKARIDWVTNYYKLALTPEHLSKIKAAFYELWFAQRPSVDKPTLWLNTGTIASGKTTLAKKKIDEWFPGLEFGVVDKDQLKAVFPLRPQIVKHYPSILFKITDEILPLREHIIAEAMQNQKCISAEQSLKSSCVKICQRAKEHGYAIVATNIAVPPIVGYARELSRFMCDSLQDDIDDTKLARREPKENIDATFSSAPKVLTEIAEYADSMHFYNSDHKKIHTLHKGEKLPPEVFEKGKILTTTAFDEMVDILAFVTHMIDLGSPLAQNADYMALVHHVSDHVRTIMESQQYPQSVTDKLALAKRKDDAQYYRDKTREIKKQWLSSAAGESGGGSLPGAPAQPQNAPQKRSHL